ncbi:Txe/YoeB family addiction module toxin [Flavobacterium sp. 7A]|uniref:Txe/YoeB family addiction module toxin n=1 Tax=Flavobacterium sp. 7A TaxID=2940571 RepID=UPI0022268C7E|nr:Txe/YoeB family addiction module toxin [Flavobacterium sp. 7A]MCW2118036.1 toxin YoeB [Flavobacterium sp. 7A]
MSYHLDFSNQAKSDIEFHKKSGNKAVLKKLLILLNELIEHPFEGTGKPEALKHNQTGCWSCRSNQEYRLVYEVLENNILLHAARGHYA